jgi:PKD repeat protein
MKQRIILALLIVFAGFASCSDDDEVVQIKAPIISGLEKAYTILEDAELELSPTIENGKNTTYVWQVDGKEVAKTLDFVFVQSTSGDYKLVLKAGNEGGVAEHKITVTVVERGLAPVITDVEKEYNLESGTDLTITPTITSDNETTYAWYLGDVEVATTLAYTFNNAKVGKHEVTFKATNQGGTTEMVFSIVVTPKDTVLAAITHKMLALEIPAYIPADNDGVEWKVLKAPSDYYRLSQTNNAKTLFVSGVEGEYSLEVTAGEISGKVKVIVAKAEQTPSAYFANAFDYLPAPGQFVNTMPKYDEGDSHDDMVAKVGKALVGENAGMITLGGWGGYVTMGFDHTIVNVAGKKDF